MRNGNLLDLANTSDYSLRFSYSYWELKKEQLTIIVYSSPINDYQKVNSVLAVRHSNYNPVNQHY